MPRILITLDPDDMAWLTRKAKLERTSMTELVRRAVRQYRKHSGPVTTELDRQLRETSGIWRHGDGLAYQNGVRKEWVRRK